MRLVTVVDVIRAMDNVQALRRPDGELSGGRIAGNRGKRIYDGLGDMTRTQVTGYQFLARRTAMALTRWRFPHGDRAGTASDPVRRGVGFRGLGDLPGCTRGLVPAAPAGTVDDAPIIANKDSGALVRVGDRLYPALNLASARLIADTRETTRTWSGRAKSRACRAGRWWASRAHRQTSQEPANVVVADLRHRGHVDWLASPSSPRRDRRQPRGHRRVLNGSDAVVLIRRGPLGDPAGRPGHVWTRRTDRCCCRWV